MRSPEDKTFAQSYTAGLPESLNFMANLSIELKFRAYVTSQQLI